MLLSANLNNVQILQTLNAKYGVTDYDKWQAIRYPFYSFVQYLKAGQSVTSFFGTSSSGSSLQLTNMPKPNSFGNQHFLIKQISFDIYVKGFVQAGMLDFQVNGNTQFQIPRPFLYAPPSNGRAQMFTAGIDTLTLTEGTPNTLLTSRSAAPSASLNTNEEGGYLVDPNLLILSDENFQVNLRYDSGAVPLLCSTIVDDVTNPFYVGCRLDGILFRPGMN
jgi:hypothetical protein